MRRTSAPAPVDVGGALCSAGGLRFGGFPTADFFETTESLEKRRPGVRAEIADEAHHLILWPDRLAEIAFVAGLLCFRSIWIALALLLVGYTVELIRFYTLGASPFISTLSRAWTLHRLWIVPLAAVLTFRSSRALAAILIAFLVVQFWLLMTFVLSFPIKVVVSAWIYGRHGREHPFLNNRERTALQWVIERWQKKLGQLVSSGGGQSGGAHGEQGETDGERETVHHGSSQAGGQV